MSAIPRIVEVFKKSEDKNRQDDCIKILFNRSLTAVLKKALKLLKSQIMQVLVLQSLCR